jgi:integrase
MDALHTFFRWLKRWGEVDQVPTWPEIEEVIEKERFALVYEDQQAALKNIPAEHRDIFEFMMETGLRPGEVCAIQWHDIDFKSRRALIRRTYSESTLRETTKQKKEQWIPLSKRACEIIDVQEKDAASFIFVNPDTRRGYRYKVLNRLWNRHSGTDVDLYEGTRHSFCTQMVEQLDLASAQKAMRHTDQRSTKRYDHSGDAKIREAMNNRSKVIDLEERRKKE